ncbi:hypothetical protein N0V90_011376 [Kalmusia sp. IMI 367209]|nr:hypothetical protein N0V90_011376 [Kalmusia sp. IMI 367209]
MGTNVGEHSEPLLPIDLTRPSSDIEDGAIREKSYNPTKFYEKKAFLYASALWFAGALLLFVSALLIYTRSRGSEPNSIIYCGFAKTWFDHSLTKRPAPVNGHVRYKTVVFDASLGKKTIYMEDPSPRVDKAWEDLYEILTKLETGQEAGMWKENSIRILTWREVRLATR